MRCAIRLNQGFAIWNAKCACCIVNIPRVHTFRWNTGLRWLRGRHPGRNTLVTCKLISILWFNQILIFSSIYTGVHRLPVRVIMMRRHRGCYAVVHPPRVQSTPRRRFFYVLKLTHVNIRFSPTKNWWVLQKCAFTAWINNKTNPTFGQRWNLQTFNGHL